MKGLEEYIKKHGYHFTEALAYKAGGKRWNTKQVMDAAQRKVYYNVTGSTNGDIVFLTNHAYSSGMIPCSTKDKCIRHALSVIGFYGMADGLIFLAWVKSLELKDTPLDFTSYIYSSYNVLGI